MKKLSVFFLLLGMSLSAFAQVTYDHLLNIPGAFSIYENEKGDLLSILKTDNAYIGRFYEKESGEEAVCTLSITKDFVSTIKLIEVNSGSEEFAKKNVIKKIEELIGYGDFNMRKNLPGGFFSTKSDLQTGKPSAKAQMDFYIPITNVVRVDYAEGGFLKCVRFGEIEADQYSYYITCNEIEKAFDRDMNKIKWLRKRNISIGRIFVNLPQNWTMKSKELQILKDTTKCDSAISFRRRNLSEEGFSDLYAMILADFYTMPGWVIPDSFKFEKAGDNHYIRIDFSDYKYGEKNTQIYVPFTTDGKTFSFLIINGYTQFIEKNWDMYKELIESATALPF